MVLLGAVHRLSGRGFLKKRPEMSNYLAMASCDSGVLIDIPVEKCPDNSGMVKVSTLPRKTAWTRVVGRRLQATISDCS